MNLPSLTPPHRLLLLFGILLLLAGLFSMIDSFNRPSLESVRPLPVAPAAAPALP